MDGAGGCFDRCRCKTDRAVLGNNDAVGAREVGSADDRAEIVGIFNLVKEHEEGILSFFRRPGKEVIDLRVLESSSLGDDALMPAGLGKLVKTLAGQKADRGMVVFCQAQYSLHGALCRTFKQKEFFDGPSGAVGFDNGIAAFDPVFVRLCLTGNKPAARISSFAFLISVSAVSPADVFFVVVRSVFFS